MKSSSLLLLLCRKKSSNTFVLFMAVLHVVSLSFLSRWINQNFHNLDKACAQFADLMLVFQHQHWMDFVMNTKISSNYIDFCLHSAQWTMSRMHSPVLIVAVEKVLEIWRTKRMKGNISKCLKSMKNGEKV